MRPGEKARTSYLASRERLQARATPTDNERFDARLRSNSRRSQLGDHAACAPARARLPRQSGSTSFTSSTTSKRFARRIRARVAVKKPFDIRQE